MLAIIIDVEELLTVDRGHAFVAPEARAYNELLSGIVKESGEVLILLILSPEGLCDIILRMARLEMKSAASETTKSLRERS